MTKGRFAYPNSVVSVIADAFATAMVILAGTVAIALATLI